MQISNMFYDYFMFQQITEWFGCFQTLIQTTVNPDDLIDKIEKCPHGKTFYPLFFTIWGL
jgi:hypothetical protein